MGIAPRQWSKQQLKSANGEYPTPYIDHWILQLHGIAPERINDPDVLMQELTRLVERLHLTRVSDHTHYFHPGVSAVIILSESHLSVHTWPELGYLHADIVTCVEKLTHDGLQTAFADAFAPERLQIDQLDYRLAVAGKA